MNIRIVEINSKVEAIKHITNIGADPYSVKLMAPKAIIRSLILENADNRAANIIKQELLSIGGDAAVSTNVSRFHNGKSDVFIMATDKQIKKLLLKLAGQPFELKKWVKIIEYTFSCYEKKSFVISCGTKKLRLNNKPVVMGILNVTPDSFSDGNKYYDADRAVKHALQMVREGAGIIDIGGESTRPGAKAVSSKEELQRVIPVIKQLAQKTKVLISIDTYKPEIAKAAIKAGAYIINDVTGLNYKNGAMADVVKRYNVPLILMHMQGTPRNMQKHPHYKDVVCDIRDFFIDRIDFALKKGINPENIIVDPGIGFGKLLKHNLEILKRLKEFRVLGRPILVGTSQKSFIGSTLGNIPAGKRLAGSIASFVWSALNGANILRVHNVKETVQALKVISAIKK